MSSLASDASLFCRELVQDVSYVGIGNSRITARIQVRITCIMMIDVSLKVLLGQHFVAHRLASPSLRPSLRPS